MQFKKLLSVAVWGFALKFPARVAESNPRLKKRFGERPGEASWNHGCWQGSIWNAAGAQISNRDEGG